MLAHICLTVFSTKIGDIGTTLQADVSNDNSSLMSFVSLATKRVHCRISTCDYIYYKCVYRVSYILMSFKIAHIKPLLKKESLDQEILKNYRPVSNLTFVSKILKKLYWNSKSTCRQGDNGCITVCPSCETLNRNSSLKGAKLCIFILRCYFLHACVICMEFMIKRLPGLGLTR